jgi:hypothetical protein
MEKTRIRPPAGNRTYNELIAFLTHFVRPLTHRIVGKHFSVRSYPRKRVRAGASVFESDARVPRFRCTPEGETKKEAVHQLRDFLTQAYTPLG